MIPILHCRTLEEFSKYDNSFDHLLAQESVKKYRDALGMVGEYLHQCLAQEHSPSLEEIIEVFNEAVASVHTQEEIIDE